MAAGYGPRAYALAAGAHANDGPRAIDGPREAEARAGAETGFRDLDAEQAILAELDVPAGRVRSAQLTGMDTMLFSTEVLPLLAGQPGVEVEISGEPG